jgi:hypothetical protein
MGYTTYEIENLGSANYRYSQLAVRMAAYDAVQGSSTGT